MRDVSYVFRRRDTGCFYFRWTIPATIRPILGGRLEVKKSLHTDQRRIALRLARRLSVMLERATTQLMASQLRGTSQDQPAAYLTINVLERLMDGSIRMEGVQLDPDPAHAEEDRRHLAALLGMGTAPAAARTDERTLADLVKAYLEEGERANRHTPKTRQELDAIFALMLEGMGASKPLLDLSRKDFAAFKDLLCRLPSNRSKNPLYRSKGVLELAGMKIPDTHKLSVTTINKILGWVGSLMGWGALHGFVAANYAEGLLLPKRKRDSEYREPYTTEEVLRVKEAVLQGLHGSADVPWKKWIPLMLAYHGMRVNEAAQMRVADVGEVDGIPTLTITPEAGRTKTSAAKRTIPLHPELIGLGFLDHVAALRKRGVMRLWPELHGGRDGHGMGVSRWWGHYREKIGFAHRDLHSLRHTVATALREADVPEDVVQEILGHARGDSESFRRYAKGSTQKRLLAALSKLHYGTTPAKPELRLMAA